MYFNEVEAWILDNLYYQSSNMFWMYIHTTPHWNVNTSRSYNTSHFHCVSCYNNQDTFIKLNGRKKEKGRKHLNETN